MNTVFLAFCDTDDALRRQDGIMRIAPSLRAVRIMGMKNDGARAQALAATWTLHLALSRALPDYAPPADFAYLADGRPSVPGICVSIAHTPGMAVCAVGNVDIGVDIERADRKINASLSKRVLAPGEKCAVIVAAWTAKEAYLKMTGEGLPGGMTNYAVSGNSITDLSGGALASVAVMPFGEYTVALCCREAFKYVCIHGAIS